MIGRRQPGNSFHLLKTRDCEPRGQAVLLGSLTLLFSAQVPLLNKVSCLVSLCVSSENSFLSVRQEPWKGSPFLQQFFSNLLKTKDTTFKKAKIAFFKKKVNFYFWLLWIFVAVCRLSLVAASAGYSLVVAYGLLIVVASHVAECGL